MSHFSQLLGEAEAAMDGSERWFSVKEVAARWAVGRDTIVRRIKAGLIKAFVMPSKSPVRNRIYRIRRIAESEVQRIERENTVPR
jgi:hypothetical protein